MVLSGFLFLFILVLVFVMAALGYLMEKDDYDSDEDLRKIDNNPKKFQISLVLALIHNSSVITLTILLFIIFSPYNLILGVVWTIFRIGEGLILFYNDKTYWGFIDIARKYSGASGSEQKSLSDETRIIFKAKDTRFKDAMVCWSIGTLAYSIVLVTTEVVPQLIGWLGIAASVIVFLSNGIKLFKPTIKVPAISALFPILFEIILGGWLLTS